MNEHSYPPGGNFPGPPGPAPAAAPPEPTKKSRRVGTITMAVCLIALGVLLVLAVFVPGIDLVFIARLLPGILVLLGIEILVAHIRHRDEKLRYDALSVVLCIVLIFCSLFAAVVPPAYQRITDTYRTANRLSLELRQKSYEALEGEALGAVSADWHVSLENSDFSADMQIEDIRLTQHVQVHVYLNSEYPDSDSFAKACHTVAKKFANFVPHIDCVSISSGSDRYESYEGEERYTLDVNDGRFFDLSAKEMGERVSAEYWAEDGYYMGEWEYRAQRDAMENGTYDDSYLPGGGEWDEEPLSCKKPVLKNGLAQAA